MACKPVAIEARRAHVPDVCEPTDAFSDSSSLLIGAARYVKLSVALAMM